MHERHVALGQIDTVSLQMRPGAKDVDTYRLRVEMQMRVCTSRRRPQPHLPGCFRLLAVDSVSFDQRRRSNADKFYSCFMRAMSARSDGV